MEAKEKNDELKEKLAEINQKLNELSQNAENSDENKSTDNIETSLAEYRQKLDQLEALILNLTAIDAPIDAPSKPTKVDEESNSSSRPNTWRSLIDLKLKRVKNIISRLSLVKSNKPAVTVTKYLPTSNQLF